MGRLDDAITLFQNAIDIEPDDTITLLNLASAYELLAKKTVHRAQNKELTAQALAIYKKIIDIDPNNVQAKENMDKLQTKQLID